MTDLKKRATEIDRRLGERYPDAKCSLDFTNPFELLIASVQDYAIHAIVTAFQKVTVERAQLVVRHDFEA